MRVLTRNSDGRIMESQSGGTENDLEVLYRNAESSGLSRDDVTAAVMADAAFAALLATQNAADVVPVRDPIAARLAAVEAVLIEKGTLRKQDVDDKVEAATAVAAVDIVK